jgi:CTP synthase
MIKVIEYARVNKVPYLGICLGMQMAVVEFCRNVLDIKDANSIEFNPETKSDVITTMDDVDYNKLGGTLRLGKYETLITDENSLAYKIYGKNVVSERHRHRYEVNLKYREQLEKAGFKFSGIDKRAEDLKKPSRMNVGEISEHPFFFALQPHPEFQTSPFEPSPVFYSFILASSGMFDKFKEYQQTRKLIPKEFDVENDDKTS